MSNKSSFFHRVNWIDGMKINKDNFIDLENSLLQNIQESYGNNLNPNNFGMLPDYSGADDNTSISVSLDGQGTLVVTIHKCNAVTLGGYRIVINDEINKLMKQSGHILQQQYTIDSKEGIWYIVLSVNLFKRIPIGDADPYEEPTRNPFVIPEYNISILPEDEVHTNRIGLHHITIGKVEWVNGQPRLQENFIPPCTSIQSHQDLIYSYTEIGSFFDKIESYSTQIIQKIFQKKQTNDLAKMVLTMCTDTLTYLKMIIPSYRANDKYAPPVAMITKLTGLARVIKGNIDIYVGTGKEELLNYLTEWCDENQGAFEGVLQEMIDFEYIHTDINKGLEKGATFTSLMTILFKKLNELDYIGKKGDSKIFVKEDKIDSDSTKNRRRFFAE